MEGIRGAGEEVRHEADRQRFVMAMGGGEGYLEYRRRAEGVLDLTYTFVPRDERGGGLGRRLVLHVLEHARENGLEVVPTCHFVATVIAEHPEYHDLVAGRNRC